MENPRFLRDLARTAREEEVEERRRWERWERLSDGALSSEGEAELRAEDRMAFEAFRPLDSDFRARIVNTIGPLVKGDAARVMEIAPSVETPVWVKRPRPVMFPWWRVGFFGSGLTATAAALFFVLRLPPLPVFAVAEVKSGVETTRSGEQDPEATPVLVAGGAFTAKARPAARVSPRATIEPRCYVLPTQPPEKKIRTADCKAPERDPRTGSMKIEGQIPGNLPTGPATLWIVLAYPGDQPEAGEIKKLPTDTPTRKRNWDAEPTPIEVRAP